MPLGCGCDNASLNDSYWQPIGLPLPIVKRHQVPWHDNRDLAGHDDPQHANPPSTLEFFEDLHLFAAKSHNN